MGRRKQNVAEAPFSLFAFQDIVTSIIGIMFLVVILLVLDLITREAGPAPEAAPVSGRVEELSRRAEELEVRLAERIERLERLRKEPAAVAVPRTGTSPETPKAEAALPEEAEKRLAELAELRKEAAEAEAALEEKRRKHREQAAALAEAEAEAADRKPDPERKILAAARKVVYLPGPGSDKEPVLVQCEPGAIKALSLAKGERLREWRGAPPVAGPAFREWARGLSAETHFFLVFVLPECAGAAMETVAWLREDGYDVGYEPLPSGHSAVFDPGEGG